MNPNEIESRIREIGDAAERARRELDRLIGEVEALSAGLSSVDAVGEPPAPPPPPAAVPQRPVAVPDPPPPPPPPVSVPDPEPQPAPLGDSAARLVAMKMAIDGSSREQIEAELSTRFGSADRSSLLDDVLARAGR